MLFQSPVPGLQVKAANTHPHPPPGERKPKARTAAAGRSVILALRGPRQVSEAPSRPRRPDARLTPAPLLPPPGPGRRSFSPARGGYCSRAARPSRQSRRLLRPAAVTGAGPRTSRSPGPVTPGGKQKPGKDQRARPASPPRGGARRGRGAALAAARLRASRREPRPRGLAGRKGAPRRAGDLRRVRLEASPAPLSPTRRSRTGEPHEEAERRSGKAAGPQRRNSAPGAPRPPAPSLRPWRRYLSPGLLYCSVSPRLTRTQLAPQPAQQAARAPDAAASRDWQRLRTGPNPPGSARRRPAPAGRRTRLP